MKLISDKNEIPRGRHYVILVQESRSEYEPPWHERDKSEGSYHTIKVWNYYAGEDRAEWEQQIIRNEGANKVFVAFVVDGLAELKKTVTFSISPGTPTKR